MIFHTYITLPQSMGDGRGQSIPSDGTRPFVVHVQPLPRVDYRSQFGCRCRVEQIFEGNLLQRLPIETQGFTKTPKTDQFRLSRAEIPIRSRVSYFVEPCDGWMLTRAATCSASQESGADHFYSHCSIWFGSDHLVTVGDQRRPVFRANSFDPIPSHHYSYSAMQADGCPSTWARYHLVRPCSFDYIWPQIIKIS